MVFFLTRFFIIYMFLRQTLSMAWILGGFKGKKRDRFSSSYEDVKTKKTIYVGNLGCKSFLLLLILLHVRWQIEEKKINFIRIFLHYHSIHNSQIQDFLRGVRRWYGAIFTWLKIYGCMQWHKNKKLQELRGGYNHCWLVFVNFDGKKTHRPSILFCMGFPSHLI